MVLRALPSGGIRVTFNDWEEVNLCALFCIIYMYSFHSAIPVGVGELRIRGFDHPPCCPKCVFQSEQWLVMSQEEESSEMGRNMMGVYSCLFTVGKGRILYFSSSQDLNFVLP